MQAVSIGMKAIFNLAYTLDIIAEDYYISAVQLLDDYGLITELTDKFDTDEFYNAMCSDKKVADKKINFVMPIKEKEVSFRNNIDKNLVIQGIL